MPIITVSLRFVKDLFIPQVLIPLSLTDLQKGNDGIFIRRIVLFNNEPQNQLESLAVILYDFQKKSRIGLIGLQYVIRAFNYTLKIPFKPFVIIWVVRLDMCDSLVSDNHFIRLDIIRHHSILLFVNIAHRLHVKILFSLCTTGRLASYRIW